jgi:hypothetical protein
MVHGYFYPMPFGNLRCMGCLAQYDSEFEAERAEIALGRYQIYGVTGSGEADPLSLCQEHAFQLRDELTRLLGAVQGAGMDQLPAVIHATPLLMNQTAEGKA